MTKLLVASGLSNGSYISSVEVIDLSASALPCQYLPNFPLNVAWPMGGLFNNNIPLICGGFDGTVSLTLFHIPLRTFVNMPYWISELFQLKYKKIFSLFINFKMNCLKNWIGWE
jgi:hypothetical protein